MRWDIVFEVVYRFAFVCLFVCLLACLLVCLFKSLSFCIDCLFNCFIAFFYFVCANTCVIIANVSFIYCSCNFSMSIYNIRNLHTSIKSLFDNHEVTYFITVRKNCIFLSPIFGTYYTIMYQIELTLSPMQQLNQRAQYYF